METTPLRVPVTVHAEAGVLARIRGTATAELLREAIRRGLDAIGQEEQERAARLATLAEAVAR